MSTFTKHLWNMQSKFEDFIYRYLITTVQMFFTDRKTDRLDKYILPVIFHLP